MRAAFLACVVALAGCVDTYDEPPDAAPRPDGAGVDAAPPDADLRHGDLPEGADCWVKVIPTQCDVGLACVWVRVDAWHQVGRCLPP